MVVSHYGGDVKVENITIITAINVEGIAMVNDGGVGVVIKTVLKRSWSG